MVQRDDDSAWQERASDREEMVERQIRPRGIRDERLLAALRSVPRERFVPPGSAGRAYDDGPLPIGERQTISQPYIVALMTSLLGLTGGERVLEIGTGSGYQTAILAEMGADIYTVEIVESLGAEARARLSDLGYAKIHYRVGDGTLGWPEAAPFDRILGAAAPRSFPLTLGEQLTVGGWAVMPIGDYSQQLVVVRREQDGFRTREHGGVLFVPMTGAAADL